MASGARDKVFAAVPWDRPRFVSDCHCLCDFGQGPGVERERFLKTNKKSRLSHLSHSSGLCFCVNMGEEQAALPPSVYSWGLTGDFRNPTRNHDCHSDLGSAACQPTAEAGAFFFLTGASAGLRGEGVVTVFVVRVGKPIQELQAATRIR